MARHGSGTGMSSTRYVAPPNVEEAVSVLASDPQARLLAGGHSLLLLKNRRSIAGSLLIDLRKLFKLAEIEFQPDGSLRIGAMATIASIGSDDLVRTRFPALAEAAEVVGDAQVRNRATLGGNLAAAEPESDLPALMLALDAQLLLKRSGGSRTLSADQFFTGPQQTVLRHDEMITAAVLPPLPNRSGIAYEKFKHPATLYALCGVAAAVTLSGSGSITAVRLAATGALSYPTRVTSFEEAVLNRSGHDGGLFSLPSSLPSDWKFRDDFFASAEYRRHLLGVLTRRALKRALERAAA